MFILGVTLDNEGISIFNFIMNFLNLIGKYLRAYADK